METRPSYDDLEKRVAELEQQVARYRSAAITYQTLFHAFPLGITVSDDQGKVIETNEIAEHLLGIGKENHLKRAINDPEWRIIRPDGSPMPAEEWASVIAIEEKRTVSNCEMGVVKTGDEVTWINVTASPLPIEGYGVVVTYGDITAKKRVEKKLVESEGRFRRYFENAGVYSYIVSPEGIVLEVSQSALDRLGYSREEIVGHPITTLYVEESIDQVNQLFETWKTTGHVHDAELVIKTKSGEKRWVILNADAVRDKTGHIVHSTSIQVDITDRKRTEINLRRSRAELQRILEATTDGIWTWDFRTDTLYFSPRYYTMLGYEPDEFPADFENWLKLIHPEDREAALAAARRYLENKPDLYENEFRLKTRNGDYRWIRTRAKVVERDRNGEALLMIGNHEDITERKQAEESLADSSRRLGEVIRAANVGLWDWDLATNRVRYSTEWKQQIGYRDDEIGAGFDEWESRVHPDDLGPTIQKVRQAIVDASASYQVEFRFRHKDGSYRWILAQSSVYCNPAGQPLRVVGSHIDITERKKREEALSLQSMVLDQIHDHVTITDLDGVITYVNQAQVKSLGYPKEALIGKPTGVYGEDVQRGATQREILEKTLAEGSWRGEVVNFDAGGREHIMDCRTQLVLDVHGKPAACCGIATDVTEYRQAMERLRRSEARYRVFFEEGPDGVVVLDPATGKIIEFNDRVCDQLGYSRDEFSTLRVSDLDIDESPEETAEHMQRVLREGRDDFETRHRTKSGEIRWVHVTAQNIHVGQESIYHCIWRDITDRKVAEIAFKEGEARYKKLVDTAPYGIQLTDLDGKIIFSNPAHHKIQGYADGELIGKYIWDLMVDEPHKSKAKAYYQKLIEEQPVPEIFFNRDRTKDGRYIDVQVNWDYIYDLNGNIEGIISIISDITSQRALESRLQQAQKMEAIGNLAGGIAHDFNNILFPILGISEMLMEDLPRGSLPYQNVKEIYTAGKRGSDLVKQILAFSRQTEHKMIPVGIQQIVREVLKLSRRTIPADIEIIQSIQTDCGLVRADPTHVHQVAMNLITNAYHAVEKTGGKISVRLHETDDAARDLQFGNLAAGRYAVLSVSDTGCGIEPAHLDKIFEPYFTTKEAGKGTGLGLATVYGIVKEHHGDIKVQSQVGQGSTFSVYLPLIEDKQNPVASPAIRMDPTGDERILLVDDEEAIVRMVKQMLERLGYRVTARHGTIDALHLFTADPKAFDLVVTDMNMPNMTGSQLAGEMMAARPDIPIIICTGFSERINQEKARAMGIKGLLMKPVVKSELAKMVRQVLDEAKQSV